MKKNNINDIIQSLKGQFTEFARLHHFGYFLIGFIGLTIINWLIISRIYGGEDFLVHWLGARQILLNATSPYSQETSQLISELAQSLSILPYSNIYYFVYPLYECIIYLPFALIKNFDLARALWMSFNIIIAFISGYLCFILLEWKIKKRQNQFLIIFATQFFYYLISLLSGNDSIIILCLLLISLLLIKREKLEFAGIVLAFTSINWPLLCIAWFFIFLTLVRKKAWTFFIWFMITLGLLLIGSLLILPEWPLQYFKAILENPGIISLQIPGEVLRQWLSSTNQWIGNLIALICLAWLILQWSVVDKNSEQFYWKFSLTLALTPLVWMRNDLSQMPILLFGYLYILSNWFKRSLNLGRNISIIFISIFSLILPILSIRSRALLFENPYSFLFYICPILVLLVNLYWIKGWIFNKIDLYK